jgi:hypothetical protein
MSYCECDYDDYEGPEFFVMHVVKARKPHRCYECGGPIFAKEKYKRSTGKWDGEVITYRECCGCMEMREWAEISVPCFCCNLLGDLHETIREMVEDVRHTVPGFFFEYGRRYIKLKRRRNLVAPVL